MTTPRPAAASLAAALALSFVVGCGSKSTPTEPAPVADAPVAKQRDDRGNIAKRKTREILDARAALARGDFIVVQEKIDGSNPIDAEYTDPLTGPLNIYTESVGFLGRLPLHQWVRMQYALEGEYPSYEELIAYVKGEPMLSMPVPKVGQHFGYDASNGGMVLLEEVSGGHPAPDVRDEPHPLGVLPVWEDAGDDAGVAAADDGAAAEEEPADEEPPSREEEIRRRLRGRLGG